MTQSGARSGDRLLRELSAAAQLGAGGDELAEALSRAIAPAVAHDAVRLVATSPAAGSIHSTFSFWHGFEPDLGRALLRSYYAGEDPSLPDGVARGPVPAAVPGTGDGRRDHLARRLRLLSAHGASGELRVLLRDARGVWGLLGLLRSQGGRPFEQVEADRAARLGPALTAVLRGYVTAGPLTPAGPAPPPGVILVGADDVIRAVTPQAVLWRRQLKAHTCGPGWTREALITGLAMQTRLHARHRCTRAPLVVGPAAGKGPWIAWHGQPLSDGMNQDGMNQDADVAIVIQAATSEQLLPALCDWYGITGREQAVIQQALIGLSIKQIARRLELSPHTVNDHLKAIYRKTGVNSRDELLAAITT